MNNFREKLMADAEMGNQMDETEQKPDPAAEESLTGSFDLCFLAFFPPSLCSQTSPRLRRQLQTGNVKRKGVPLLLQDNLVLSLRKLHWFSQEGRAETLP